MSTTIEGPAATAGPALADVLSEIAGEAGALDREPRFPREAFAALADAGALGATLGDAIAAAPVRPGWELLRRVAAADASVGRILDGHLNAVERIEVAAPASICSRELGAVAAGERLLGVWGADPRPGEGPPARIADADGEPTVSGAKTYCSGAGGIDAALVAIGSDAGTPPRLVLVECDERVEVDRGWYRAAGLRASESHRVVFHEARVLTVLGGPGELGRDPWFSRDAMRTAACWVGMIDALADSALAELAARRERPEATLAAGQIESARRTAEAWLARGEAAIARGAADLRGESIAMRAELDRAAKRAIELAAAACGSHPFVTGARLDRARRDLETFLLQHRLEPLLSRFGAERLDPA